MTAFPAADVAVLDDAMMSQSNRIHGIAVHDFLNSKEPETAARAYADRAARGTSAQHDGEFGYPL
jgi:hypothetical protein